MYIVSDTEFLILESLIICHYIVRGITLRTAVVVHFAVIILYSWAAPIHSALMLTQHLQKNDHWVNASN